MAENTESAAAFQSNAGTKKSRMFKRKQRRSERGKHAKALRESSKNSSSLSLPPIVTAARPPAPAPAPASASAPKPIPEAYFVDVCASAQSTSGKVIDLGSSPRTYHGYLPLDVLGEIFVLCLPSDVSLRTRRNEAPLVLSHVCRHWRRVSLDLSILWNAFSAVKRKGRPLFQRQLLHLFIHRSRTRPLKFKISAPAENGFMEVLMAHVSQWKEVTVVFGESRPFAELFFNISSTPILEVLTVDATTCVNQKILEKIPEVTADMANLRRLIWMSKKIPTTFLAIPVHQLVHLDLWCALSMQDCLTILTYCSKLVTLKLDLKGTSSVVPATSSFITIPTLIHIDVIVYCELVDFLSHFTLPSLRFIRVMHRQRFTHNFVGLEEFCNRSRCTLETFWVNDRRQTAQTIIRYIFLPCLQSIRELHILAGGIDDAFFKALMVPETRGSCEALLLPRLKRIIVGRCTTTDGIIAHMIESRCRSDQGIMQDTCFEVVSVLFRVGMGKSGVSNRHPEDIMRFKTFNSRKSEVRVFWEWK